MTIHRRARVAALQTQLQEQARILVNLAHKLQDKDLQLRCTSRLTENKIYFLS